MTKAARTRQFIIEKAATVLNKKGMAGTSISDIMEATKLAKGGIYGNFKDKEEICLEAFNYLSQNLSGAAQLAMLDKAGPKEKLFALLDNYNEKLVSGTGGGCPILNFGVEADDTSPLLTRRVGEAISIAQLRIKDLVTEGIASGVFRQGLNAEEFAIKMFTMLEGAIFTSRVFGHNKQMQVVISLLKSEITSFSG
ncbi:TetR/AcrR family transcriptional regulator [Hufsiella ginkgonis]|uniref:TetR family transcriptional regulator n=1 Tax=Hufsiella ginkgonis TaxID=2695274 RepID=A0A7K1XWF2_9SPHI|nr:TetR/AcrR family transcriptional regulator [Hufsiella ginkgonis]MXV15333.1 TetR family transcriptional regulator [Hufsiella ginkgonis]